MKNFTLVLLLAAIAFMLPFNVSAAYLRNEPMTIEQPDGSVYNCFATGDEFYNWLHDANNYTIIQSETDGYFYFAELVSGKLKPSSYRVGSVDPLTTSLLPGANITGEEMRQIRKNFEDNFGFNESGQRDVKAAGTLNNLVIYIRFSDQNEFTFDTLVNYNKFNNMSPTANSVYTYFKEISYDQLTLHSTFYPVPPENIVISYQDVHPRTYFMPYNATTAPDGYQTDNQRTQREHQLLADAVTYINLNSPVSPDINLDYNNDNRVDNIVFIIKGAPTAWSTLLWPHRWSLNSQTVYINGKRVWDFNFQLETHMVSSGVGVLCHELYHSLGAPDLYRYVDTSIDPVGPWDVMASNNNPPQYMNAFMKYKYGNWISDIPWITENGTYTINPLSNSENNAYRIQSLNSTSEYFLVEYRKKEGTFDATLPKSGMLIYRINPSAGNGNAQGPPDEVYVFRPNGSNTNSGSINNAVFGSGYGRTEFNDFTNPNAFLQNGGLGGVFISDISAVGETMTFTVNFPGPTEASFTSDLKVVCAGDPVHFYDTSLGIPSSWLWTFEPNLVTYLEGTSATSKNPVVKFDTEGNYTANLTVGNTFGFSTSQQPNYLHIGARQGYFAEDFESGEFSEGSWTIENPDESITWGMHSVGGNGGTMAAGINFRTYFSIQQKDRLVSMPFDLSGMSAAYLSFEHAYAQNATMTTYSDSLYLYISTDCGVNWNKISTFAEDGTGSFATHLPTETEFFPEIATDWCGQGWGSPCNTIDLSSYAGQSDIRLAFETVSFYGNPILIDNIVVSQFVGTVENNFEATDVQIAPNPSNGSFNIQLTGATTEAKLKLFNPIGQLMYETTMSKSITLNKNENWLPGMYLIQIENGKSSIVKKIVIQ